MKDIAVLSVVARTTNDDSNASKDKVAIFYVNILNKDTKNTTIRAKKIPCELEITPDKIICMVKEDEQPLFAIERDKIRLIELLKPDTLLLNFFYFHSTGEDRVSVLHWGKQGAMTQVVLTSEHCLSIIKELTK